MKRLKAYQVSDGNDGCCIYFAANSATARREGAAEIGVEWEDIDYCNRKPEFDEYAPGPVPPLVLIDGGWWFECHKCGRSVSESLHGEVECDGLDPADFEIVAEGRTVFCSRACSATHYAERRANAAAQVALIELFDAKYPDCTIERVHVYGKKLEGPDGPCGGMKCSVSFTFPGAKYGATYEYGSPDLYVAQGDIDAYHAWRQQAGGAAC